MLNWKKEKLVDVADIKMSNVDKKTHEDETPIQLCNYTDVYKNSYISKDKSLKFMFASCKQNEYDKFVLKKGQVAITKDSEKANDIGIPTYISESLDNVLLGYHLSLITPFEKKLDGKFLRYWLDTKQAKTYFENNASGSGQRYFLALDTVKDIPLFLPELSEQKKISNLLFNLDVKIELNNKINKELEAMAKTLYDYWFVQFDFPDENGKPYKSSGGKMVYSKELKREIPEGWGVENIFKLMDVQYGFPFDTSKFTNDVSQKPIVRIRDILQNTISTYSSEEIDNKFMLNKNDLLIGMDGNFHINFWNETDAYLNQRSVRIRTKEDSEISNFQVYFEITPYIKAREKNVSRTTVGHLSDKDLKSLFLLVPNLKLNHKSVFDSILNKLTTNKVQNQELAKLRDWLLPMLMNGQVKVK